MAFLIAVAIWQSTCQDRAYKRNFDAMSPTAHLDASRAALSKERFDDAMRHLSAIATGTPEALEATRISEEVAAARQAKQLEEEGKARLEEERRTAARNLSNSSSRKASAL